MTKNVQKTTSPNKRSPNYPYYDLEECIGFINKLNKQVGFREVHVEEAVKYMGHSPTSSTSNRVLASLYSFGLIEDRGGGESKFVWLSRLAQEMMMEKSGKDNPIPDKLLKQAALNDSLMLAIWKKWGSNLPPRQSIEKALVFDLFFSQPGAKRFALVLIKTYDYAHLKERDEPAQNEDNAYETEMTSIEQSNTILSTSRTPPQSSKTGEDLSSELTDYTLPLKGGKKKVILRAPLGLNYDDFNHIINWINLLKIGLISETEGDDADNKEFN